MTNKNNQESNSRILIVEDQHGPLEALEVAVKRHGFREYDVARSYFGAEEKIAGNSYDVILLDHRMPYEDKGDLDERDLKTFSDTLENIGYSLIPKIKERNPDTVVVGTSSLSAHELRSYDKPDFTMEKTWGGAYDDLERILSQLQLKGGHE
jgi:CheY-like chemotaxis protein